MGRRGLGYPWSGCGPMPEANYRPKPDLTPAERGAERRRRQSLIHERLMRWGEWHSRLTPALSAGAASIEARLMRTAPGELSTSKLPRAFLCGTCQERIVRHLTPTVCPKCGGRQILPRQNYSHGTETRGARGSEGPGDPDAEMIDRAVAAMGLARPRLKTVVMLVYLRGYSTNLVAEYLNCAWYQARAWIESAQCWVEGWLDGRGPKS